MLGVCNADCGLNIFLIDENFLEVWNALDILCRGGCQNEFLTFYGSFPNLFRKEERPDMNRATVHNCTEKPSSSHHVVLAVMVFFGQVVRLSQADAFEGEVVPVWFLGLGHGGGCCYDI